MVIVRAQTRRRDEENIILIETEGFFRFYQNYLLSLDFLTKNLRICDKYAII